MLSLTAYFDESERGGEYAVAGYLSHTDAWDQIFHPKWMDALNCSPRPISEFKASDCRAQAGEFKGWERGECDALTKRVVDVIIEGIAKDDLVGFGMAVTVPEHMKASGFSHAAFGLCIGVVFSQALYFFKKLRKAENDQLSIVADEKEGFYWKMMESWETVKKETPLIDVQSPVAASSKKVPGLQAADLLAYETQKEIRSRVEACRDGAPPIRPASKALERLIEGRQHVARVVDLKFQILAQVARQRGEPPPEPNFLYQSGYVIRDRFANAWTTLYEDEP